MWRIVKAEVFYRIWQPLGIYLIFWLFNGFILFSVGQRPLKHEYSFMTLCAMMSVLFPFWMVTYHLFGREFKENRIRLMMMLPLNVRSVGSMRLMAASSFLILALPFSLLFLLPLNLASGWAFVWLFLSLDGLTLGGVLYFQIANELQYLAKSHKVLTMFIFSSVMIFLVPYIFSDLYAPIKQIYWFLARQTLTPWGAAISILFAALILAINRDLFTKRMNYADVHKPERSLFDFLRTFRGQKTYRNQL